MQRQRGLSLIDPRRIFSDDFFETFIPSSNLVSTGNSTIDVDLYEEEDKLVAKFSNISGFDEKDLDISIEDNILTVSGNVEETNEDEDKKKKYYCKEIRKESFTRSMSLPVKVKPENTSAEIKKGVLTIEMPKAEEAKPKRISIKAQEK